MKIAVLLVVLVLAALTGACTSSSPTAPTQTHPIRMDQNSGDTIHVDDGGHTMGSGG